MLIFTPEGPRSIDDRDVLCIYRDKPDGSLGGTLCGWRAAIIRKLRESAASA